VFALLDGVAEREIELALLSVCLSVSVCVCVCVCPLFGDNLFFCLAQSGRVKAVCFL